MIAHTVVDSENAAIAATPTLSAEVAMKLVSGFAVAVLAGNNANITAMIDVDKAAANSESACVFLGICAVLASRAAAPKPYKPSVWSLLINIMRTSRSGDEPSNWDTTTKERHKTR